MPYTNPWPAPIDRVYAAIGDDQRFCDALAELRPGVGANTVLMVTVSLTRDGLCRHIAAVGVPPESMVEYESHFQAHDVWVRAAQSRGMIVTGTVASSDDLLDRQDLEQSYIWRAFLSRYRTTEALSSVLETPEEDGIFTFMTFHRHEEQARFGAAEKARVAEWLPHLRNAMKLHRRLAPQIAIGKTLDTLFAEARSPMVVLDGRGRVSRHNPAWGEWAERQRDQVRQDAHGLLLRRDGAGFEKVADAVHALLQPTDTPQALQLPVSAGWRLTLRRIEHGQLTGALPSAERAIGIVEPVDHQRPEVLRQRFGLTTAQARVAAALLGGQTPGEVAAGLGVSLPTVRSHIAALYEKTHTRRLPVLVARLLSRES